MADRIPKIIWQTYKTEYKDLPNNAREYAQRWQELNPSYEYNYMDDVDIENFVYKHYGKDMLKLLRSFKVPVMKADLWRYLIIYKFGGVYSDIDTVPSEPLDNWIDLSKSMIVGIENGMHYTQWSFMAEPNSPIIKSIIDLVLERCKKIDYNKKEFVHYYTANDVFSEGIRRYFNLPSLEHNCEDMRVKKNCWCNKLQDEALSYASNKQMIESRFFCFSGDEWHTFRDGKIKHAFGSQYWNEDPDYQSWINHPIAKKSREG